MQFEGQQDAAGLNTPPINQDLQILKKDSGSEEGERSSTDASIVQERQMLKRQLIA